MAKNMPNAALPATADGLERPVDLLLGEIQADLGAVLFRPAIAVVVDLHDDVGVLRQEIARPFRQIAADLARCPAPHAAWRREADAHADRVAGAEVLGMAAVRRLVAGGSFVLLLLFHFEPSSLARRVDEQQHMMDDARIAGPNLDGGDVLVSRSGWSAARSSGTDRLPVGPS